MGSFVLKNGVQLQQNATIILALNLINSEPISKSK